MIFEISAQVYLFVNFVTDEQTDKRTDQKTIYPATFRWRGIKIGRSTDTKMRLETQISVGEMFISNKIST